MKIRASGLSVEVSHPEKVLFPATKIVLDGRKIESAEITKSELVEYYRTVAPVIIPYLRGRPLAMERFPDGIDGGGFMQKKMPISPPPYVHAVDVPRVGGGSIEMVSCDNVATLVYLANLGAVTLHPWLSRAASLARPDRLIFDLDPADDDFETVRSTALALHDLLDELGLPAYPMTTGSRGMHVTIPITPRDEFDSVRQFAHDVADVLVARRPDALTTEPRKVDRGGRLFVDTLRNGYAQHAVAPYSVRPLPGAPIAAPLPWSEVEDPRLTAQRYTIRTISERLGTSAPATADPWRDFGRRKGSLARARVRLRALTG